MQWWRLRSGHPQERDGAATELRAQLSAANLAAPSGNIAGTRRKRYVRACTATSELHRPRWDPWNSAGQAPDGTRSDSAGQRWRDGKIRCAGMEPPPRRNGTPTRVPGGGTYPRGGVATLGATRSPRLAGERDADRRRSDCGKRASGRLRRRRAPTVLPNLPGSLRAGSKVPLTY